MSTGRAARAVNVALVAVVLAGCSFLPGREFGFGFPANDNSPEVLGVLTDKTGAVIRVTTVMRVDPAPPIDRGMMTFADEPNAVMAHWIGGACDENVEILVTPDGGTTITVSPNSRPEACDLAGVPRYVMIYFAGPVDVSRTTIRFEP